MNTQPLPPSPGKTEPGRRRTFALIVSSASAMLAGIAIGYALGVFAVWLVRFMLSRPSSPPATRACSR